MNGTTSTLDWGGYHPMFLPEDGSTEEDFPPPKGKKELKMIQVSKLEHGEEVKLIPGRLDPTEITQEADLLARWGPGTYVLTARTINGDIYAKRRVVIRDPNAAPSAPSGAPPQAVRAPQVGMAGSEGMFLAVLQMMNENSRADREREARAAEERARRDQLNSQMMMQQQAANTQLIIAALGQANTSSSEMMRTVVGLMGNARSGGAGSSDSVAMLQKIYDLSKTMAPKADASGDWTSIAQMVGGFLGGMAEAARTQQQGAKATPDGAPAPAALPQQQQQQEQPQPAQPVQG